jgi:hypothetical protein
MDPDVSIHSIISTPEERISLDTLYIWGLAEAITRRTRQKALRTIGSLAI